MTSEWDEAQKSNDVSALSGTQIPNQSERDALTVTVDQGLYAEVLHVIAVSKEWDRQLFALDYLAELHKRMQEVKV